MPPVEENRHKDEEILALSLKKPHFFGFLVDRYQEAFLRAASRIVNHKEESQDIVQEAFTKIYLNAGKFKKQEGASFKSWAYKIVINTSLTHYKKLKKTRGFVEYFDSSFYESPSEENLELSADLKLMVSNVLESMPEHLQGVLKKYYLEDKSQKDIAIEEDISSTAVKMRLFRAKKFFKKNLEQNKNLCATITI